MLTTYNHFVSMQDMFEELLLKHSILPVTEMMGDISTPSQRKFLSISWHIQKRRRIQWGIAVCCMINLGQQVNNFDLKKKKKNNKSCKISWLKIAYQMTATKQKLGWGSRTIISNCYKQCVTSCLCYFILAQCRKC